MYDNKLLDKAQELKDCPDWILRAEKLLDPALQCLHADLEAVIRRRLQAVEKGTSDRADSSVMIQKLKKHKLAVKDILLQRGVDTFKKRRPVSENWTGQISVAA